MARKYGDEISLVPPGAPGFNGSLFAIQAASDIHEPSLEKADFYSEDGEFNTTVVSIRGITFNAPSRGCDYDRDDDGQCGYAPLAFECFLRPCFQAVDGGMIDGRYFEHVVSYDYMSVLPDTPMFQYVLQSNDGCSISRKSSDSHNTPVHASTNSSGLDKPVKDAIGFAPQDCVYTLGRETTKAFRDYMKSVINNATIKYKEYPVPKTNPPTPLSVEGDEWLKKLWDNGKVTLPDIYQFVGSLAASIGAEMRRGVVPKSKDVIGAPMTRNNSVLMGTSNLADTCLEVSGQLPVFLLWLWFAQALLFYLSISRWGWRNVNIDWKASELLLLLLGISRTIREINGDDGEGEGQQPVIKEKGKKKSTSAGHRRFASTEGLMIHAGEIHRDEAGQERDDKDQGRERTAEQEDEDNESHTEVATAHEDAGGSEIAQAELADSAIEHIGLTKQPTLAPEEVRVLFVDDGGYWKVAVCSKRQAKRWREIRNRKKGSWVSSVLNTIDTGSSRDPERKELLLTRRDEWQEPVDRQEGAGFQVV